jgi:dipeptidyl aminopeptidase/acylaminoacyl peptidase
MDPRRKLTVVPPALAAVAGAGALVLAWRGSGIAMNPPPGQVAWSLDDYPDLSPEVLTVHSRTGVDLTGRFFRGADPATVIVSHGYGGTQDEMLPVANALHQVGFNVFTYALRGCGGSDGSVTLGGREQDDLRSVIDAIASRSDVDPERIGALGFSMGASTTILEAAADPRVKAVVADSGWSDVRHWVRPRLRDVVLRPTLHFSPLSLKLVELRAGIRLSRLRPSEVIGQIAPRPILIIHGTADEVVPPTDAELNAAAAGPEHELWAIGGAAHGDTIRPGGATTSPRVTDFFRRALRG